jgi:hypothetical protein
MLDSEPPPATADSAVAPTPEAQYAMACADWRLQHERHRLLGARAGRSAAGVAMPDEISCRRYCDLAIDCTRQGGDASALPACLANCTRGDFGPQHYVDRVLELRSCDHL